MDSQGGGVFGEDENRFVFTNVLVGARAKARFRIANTQKVPCDVVFTIRAGPLGGGTAGGRSTGASGGKAADVFEIEPSRAQIASHSHTYVTVTFCPPSMQVRLIISDLKPIFRIKGFI